MVQVMGSGFKAGAGLGCMFALASGTEGEGEGRVMTEGRWETSSMMTCMSPRAGSEQTVSVEVSNNGGADLTASGVQFVYERAPTVDGVGLEEVQTAGGASRRVLRVTGKHFVQSAALRCSLGHEARYVSSSLVRCHVDSKADKGNATVEVSNNGQDYSNNGFAYALSSSGSWRALALYPSSGPSQGGTMVTVSGGAGEPSEYITCMFGDSLPIEAELLEDGRLICRVPATG